MAAISALSVELRSNNSATAVLDAACAAAAARIVPLSKALHAPGKPPRISAHQVPVPPPRGLEAQARVLLHAPADEPLAYRRVRLACGHRVLSDAHNWYRPSALTASMREQLAATKTPFGRVVLPLKYTRTHCADQVFWPPLCPDADDGEMPDAGGDTTLPLVARPLVLEHCAVLTAQDARFPFCVVIERYTTDALAFHSGCSEC